MTGDWADPASDPLADLVELYQRDYDMTEQEARAVIARRAANPHPQGKPQLNRAQRRALAKARR